MFNLKEKHIVVPLVLISVIFLLFLSTRSPTCIKEGLTNVGVCNNDQLSEVIGNDTKLVLLPLEDDVLESNIIKLEKKEKKVKKVSSSDVSVKPESSQYESAYNNKNKMLSLDKESESLKMNGKNNMSKIEYKNNANPILLTKKKIKEFKNIYDMEKTSILEKKLNNNDSDIPVMSKSLKSSRQGSAYNFKDTYNESSPKPNTEYISVSEKKYFNLNSDENDMEKSNIIKEVINSMDNKLNNSGLLYNNNTDDISTGCDREDSVLVGFDNRDNIYGLLRSDIHANISTGMSNKLEDSKCNTLRGAIKELSNNGHLNNSKTSWNDTFKETCGEW